MLQPSRDAEETLRRDTETLHRWGYAQELSRRMSAFGNFAISFMVIGVFFAGCSNMQQGFSTAGMFGLTVAWLLGSAIAFATAASLGEISSAIPTAGGLYHWSSVLGGRGWGWATAWINLISYIYGYVSNAVVTYLLFQQVILGWTLHWDTSAWGYWHQFIGAGTCMVANALLNHFGVRQLAWISEAGAYLTFAGSLLLFGVLIYNIHPGNIAHTFEFTNYTGAAGGDTVPRTTNLWLVFGYALLLPMWINSSYDAAAHTSEETVDAARAVPRAMMNSVLLSAVVGAVLFVLLAWSMRDPAAIAHEGSNAFAALFAQLQAPGWIKGLICVSLVIAAFVCDCCVLTGFSRAVFAFARDRGLPSVLRHVSPTHRTPSVAIWVGAVAGLIVSMFTSALTALTAAVALLYQLSYGMAIGAAMLARHRTYGPFRLGAWSKPFGAFAIGGGLYILWVGIQPPTAYLINYFIGIFGLLLIGWFAVERRRFPGPPTGEVSIQQRQAAIQSTEKSLREIRSS